MLRAWMAVDEVKVGGTSYLNTIRLKETTMNAIKFPAAVAYTKFLTFVAYFCLILAGLGCLLSLLSTASGGPQMLLGIPASLIAGAFGWFTFKFAAEMVQVFLHIEANTERTARPVPLHADHAVRPVPPSLPLEDDEWSHNSRAAAK